MLKTALRAINKTSFESRASQIYWARPLSSSSSLWVTRPKSSASSSESTRPPRSVEEARSQAWYLEDEPSPSRSSAPESSSRRQPVFTTFDPSRTTSDSEVQPIQPLDPSAPDWLRPLHDFMTSEQAAEVLESHTVVFMPTIRSPSVRPDEEIRGEGSPGPLWDWVVAGVVKGTGKGVVGRADRAVRRWLRDNPSIGKVETFSNSNDRRSSGKFPRIPEDSDWSLICLPNRKLCINLFTAEGREHWDLEELWTGQSKLKIKRAPEAEEQVSSFFETRATYDSRRLW
ncbi:hypothetical protein BD324DRAFT_632813 [Kockovaella imperatae]|uniref:Uncharacterized protein n=1 Tax=Kockovaella imperatae TaxID=4999 RepID=A0A1Y1UBQ6_9TREE|nr:hypothetical protein BD324DRAFT_632813 [Kockovaella imperatae]ORX35432.1 hypothetical protein BD324DRAFT_632813 [Kockovaella imperatae]